MAHHPDTAFRTFHVVEVKGRTVVESDFYDTFGQLFPIDDPAVTRGWTNNKVPKHGNCLKHAQRFRQAWADSQPPPRITLVVAVPDFPAWGHEGFFLKQTFYYADQAAMYARFLETGDAAGDGAFPRLLRHLRDKYGLLDSASTDDGIAFRFWGYQGLRWVRDFATNEPVVVPRA